MVKKTDQTLDTLRNMIYAKSLNSKIAKPDVRLLNTLPLNRSVALLQDIFDKESDSTVKSRAFHAILSIRKLDKVQFLLDVFDKSSIDWQIAYCRAFARFYDSRATKKLQQLLLECEDPDIRFVAVETLGEIGDSGVIEALEYAQKNDNGTDFEGFRIADVASEALTKIRDRINPK